MGSDERYGQKTYSECLDDLTKDELFKGLLAHGIFEEKIPNFLSSKKFYKFCINQTKEFYNNTREPSKFVTYESMRNINVPREISIPNPMAYRHLCYELSENWDKLKEHFRVATEDNTHKISRIHIRKIENQERIFERCYDEIESSDIDDTVDSTPTSSNLNHIFEVNHKNFCADDYPEPLLLIGAKYLVTADISNCFPSIYSHSISWALVTKNTSKAKIKEDTWFNNIDLRTRNLKDAETQGVLIGPHASNIISEIVLVKIDENLFKKGHKFIRHIDDYSCYSKSRQEADKFLIDLSLELKKYTLILNHKKTKIEELPLASSEHWIRQLKRFVFVRSDIEIGLNEVRSFLDIALELMSKHENNASVMNYAVRILSKQKLTKRATDYFIKTIHHLVLLYPYLIQLLDRDIFDAFDIEVQEIEKISKDIYIAGKEKNFYEAMSYAVYFALKYNFKLYDNLYDDAYDKSDCILMLLCFIYDRKNTKDEKLSTTYMKQYKKLANELKKDEMDNYWLFIYEVLTEGALKGYWRKMKKDGVTFIKKPILKHNGDYIKFTFDKIPDIEFPEL